MEALEDYVVKTVGKVAQCQTHPRRGHLIRGIVTEERFIDEITWLCPVIPLTSLDELRKIRGIQGTKEKTASGPSALATSTKELPTAHSHRKSVAASGALVKYSLHGHWRSFYGCG